jgi:hypothetical protein
MKKQVSRWRALLLIWIVLVLSGAAVPAGWAGEKLVVRLRSGRSFAGQLDARSDEKQLWLRFGKESMSILRPLAWDSVVSASMQDREISLQQLREVVRQLEPSDAPSQIRTRVTNTPDDMATLRSDVPTTLTTSQIQTVHFEAELANWDSDVAMDGLVVTLIPADLSGRAVPARGVLQVELVAAKRRASHTVPRGRGQVTERLGRWTQVVRAADFEYGRARLRFPFGTSHPEFDTSWASQGLVHVKFCVAGQGVFEASQDAIRIRPYAPLRDARELRGQPRFLASER